MVSNSTISNGTWYHVVGTYDQIIGQLRVYIDGQLEGQSPYSSPVFYSPEPRNGIGGTGAFPFNFFGGKIDELRVYSRAINECEVKYIFNGKTPPILIDTALNFCSADSNFIIGPENFSNYDWYWNSNVSSGKKLMLDTFPIGVTEVLGVFTDSFGCTFSRKYLLTIEEEFTPYILNDTILCGGQGSQIYLSGVPAGWDINHSDSSLLIRNSNNKWTIFPNNTSSTYLPITITNDINFLSPGGECDFTKASSIIISPNIVNPHPNDLSFCPGETQALYPDPYFSSWSYTVTMPNGNKLGIVTGQEHFAFEETNTTNKPKELGLILSVINEQNCFDSFDIEMSLEPVLSGSILGDSIFCPRVSKSDYEFSEEYGDFKKWLISDGVVSNSLFSRTEVIWDFPRPDARLSAIVSSPESCPDDTINLNLPQEYLDTCQEVSDALFIPNSISPNGDGVNDNLFIKGRNLFFAFEIEILNRWGKSVFYSQNYKGDWGMEENPAAGIYYYQLIAKGLKERVYKGYFHVVR